MRRKNCKRKGRIPGEIPAGACQPEKKGEVEEKCGGPGDGRMRGEKREKVGTKKNKVQELERENTNKERKDERGKEKRKEMRNKKRKEKKENEKE